MQTEPRRAEEPRPPAASRAVERLKLARQAYLQDREDVERRSVWRGLLWLALAALCFGVLRAGLERSFYTGWWRQW